MKRVYDNKAVQTFRAGPFEPAYLFGGEDGYRIGRALASLRDRALVDASRDFNLDVYNGMDNSAGDVVSAALSMPMMADMRVVVVKAADKLRKLDPIAEYLADPSPTTVIIMTAEGADRTKIESMARQLPAGAYVFFSNPGEAEMARLIIALGGEHGYRIDPDAAEYVKDMVGGSMSLAESELRKVFNHVGDKKTVGIEDVTEAVGDFGLPVIFRIADALAAGDLSGAVMMFAKLNREGIHPLNVLALLAGHWRKLLGARDLMDAGVPGSEIAGKLRLNFFNKDSVLRQARSMTGPELAAGLRRIAETDRRLKSTAVPGRVEMELLFAEMAGAAGPGRGAG